MNRFWWSSSLALSLSAAACSVPAPATDDSTDPVAGNAGSSAAGASTHAGSGGSAGATNGGASGAAGAQQAGAGGNQGGSAGGGGATTAGSSGQVAAGTSGGGGTPGGSGAGGQTAGAGGQSAGAGGQAAGAGGQTAGAAGASEAGQGGAGGQIVGDTCAATVVVLAVPFVVDAITHTVTPDYGVDAAECAGVSTSQGHASPDAVYAFTPSESGTYDVLVEPSKLPTLYDPLLYVATTCPPVAGTCLGASDEVPLPSTGGNELLTLTLTAGATVYVFVDGTYDKNGSAEGASGNYKLSITKRPLRRGASCGGARPASPRA